MKEVPLSRGLVTLVDDDDYDLVVSRGSWYADPCCSTYYARRNEPYYDDQGVKHWRTVKLHRFLTGWDIVDHINGNGLDNRRANLRPVTSRQSAMNRGRRSDNKSGFKGVSRRRGGRWTAEISVNGERMHLGTHHTPDAAARAYDLAAIKHFGEFARINFPRESYAA